MRETPVIVCLRELGLRGCNQTSKVLGQVQAEHLSDPEKCRHCVIAEAFMSIVLLQFSHPLDRSYSSSSRLGGARNWIALTSFQPLMEANIGSGSRVCDCGDVGVCAVASVF